MSSTQRLPGQREYLAGTGPVRRLQGLLRRKPTKGHVGTTRERQAKCCREIVAASSEPIGNLCLLVGQGQVLIRRHPETSLQLNKLVVNEENLA